MAAGVHDEKRIAHRVHFIFGGSTRWPTPTINDNINLLFIYLLLFILITDDGASHCWFDKQKRRQQQQQTV